MESRCSSLPALFSGLHYDCRWVLFGQMLRTATWHCILRDIPCLFWRLWECCAVSVEETGCLWISMYFSPTSDLCYAQTEGINGKLHRPLLPFSECQVGRDIRTLCAVLCMGRPRAAEPGPGPVLYWAVTTYSGANSLKSWVLLPRGARRAIAVFGRFTTAPFPCGTVRQKSHNCIFVGSIPAPSRPTDTAFLSQAPWLLKLMSGKSPYTVAASLPPACAHCSLCRIQSSLVLQPGYHLSQVEEIINLFLISFRSGCSWSKNKKHSLTAKSNWPWVTDCFKLS